MRIFLTVFLAAMVTASVAYAQSEETKRRGQLPEDFHLPDAPDQIHFTSMQPPKFTEPEYPAVHRQNGIEGAVEVEIFVTAHGDVVAADITVSSGDPLFDDEALRCAMKSTFPEGYAMVNGRPSDFRYTLPVYFLLSADPEQYWQSRLELARAQQNYETAMKEFQEYLTKRTTVSTARMESTRKRLEETVAIAKGLHRTCAEKKEQAILRLRDEITVVMDRMETRNDNLATFMQRDIPAEQAPRVEIALSQEGLSTTTNPNGNDLDRLQQELEIKKSYL